jgi:hypothetical protein
MVCETCNGGSAQKSESAETRFGGFPANRISQVRTMLDPATAE